MTLLTGLGSKIRDFSYIVLVFGALVCLPGVSYASENRRGENIEVKVTISCFRTIKLSKSALLRKSALFS